MSKTSNMRIHIVIFLLLFACTSRMSDESVHQQAIRLHNSMVKKQNMMEHHLNELRADASVNQDSVNLLVDQLRQWKAALIEVPGNTEHDHEGHAHSHDVAATDVTAEQMLEIQKELDERLSAIGKRISRLKPENNHAQHKH